MPFVDVVRPECGQFTRFFPDPETAERYRDHMINDRGYQATIRPEQDMIAPPMKRPVLIDRGWLTPSEGDE